MIEEIYIRDLGVIEEARLEFGRGLTVLTGETGAGKTMVLTALGLLLGERSDSSAVRQGEQQALVEGRWYLRDAAAIAERLEAAGIELESGELILNRSVSAEGRGRAAAAGRAAPVSLLNEIGQQLVVVHGQSDQIRLKSSTAQREALDQFAGGEFANILAQYSREFARWRELVKELESANLALETRDQEIMQLRELLADLEQAALQPGEEVALSEQAAKLTHSEELRIAATAAHEALSTESFQGESDAIGLLGQARKALESVSHHDPSLQALAEKAKDLGYLLNDLAADVSSYLADIEAEGEQTLEQVQQRRSQITSLTKKYNCTFDELLELEKSAATKLLLLDSGAASIDALTAEIESVFESVRTLAAQLTKLRTDAARALAEQVNIELKSLAMPGASLVVEVSPAEYGVFGADSVSIQLSSYAGAEPRPLGKGASGGELSRIMLAIEVVLAKTEQAPTFIFDEVDAGVGGAAAIEVGRRLSMLSKQAQVIVVTHLAQVAAFADRHLKVSKTSTESFTASDVASLTGQAREIELARMLSGLTESETALLHARELLELANKS